MQNLILGLIESLLGLSVFYTVLSALRPFLRQEVREAFGIFFYSTTGFMLVILFAVHSGYISANGPPDNWFGKLLSWYLKSGTDLVDDLIFAFAIGVMFWLPPFLLNIAMKFYDFTSQPLVTWLGVKPTTHMSPTTWPLSPRAWLKKNLLSDVIAFYDTLRDPFFVIPLFLFKAIVCAAAIFCAISTLNLYYDWVAIHPCGRDVWGTIVLEDIVYILKAAKSIASLLTLSIFCCGFMAHRDAVRSFFAEIRRKISSLHRRQG